MSGFSSSLEPWNQLPVADAMRKKIIQLHSMVKAYVFSESGEDTDQKLLWDVDIPVLIIIDPHVLYIHEAWILFLTYVPSPDGEEGGR